MFVTPAVTFSLSSHLSASNEGCFEINICLNCELKSHTRECSYSLVKLLHFVYISHVLFFVN